MGLLDNVIGAVTGQQQNQNGGYPPQQGYQQQNGGYPPQQGYQQQNGGYPPQQGYQQQNGGYPQQQNGNYPPQQNNQWAGDLPPVVMPQGQRSASVVNELYLKAWCTQGQKIHSKAGAMIAFTGHIKFAKELLGPGGNPIGAAISQIGRRLTGENLPLMACTGQGYIMFASDAQHVTLINLAVGETVSVESENILAFSDSCRYGGKFLAQGVISQKGLFTSTLTGNAPGAWAAILTDGNPMMIPGPCNVDPDALVAWTGSDPGLKLDIGWKNLIGQASGESYNFQFKGNSVAIVQPNERKSGLDIGIDNHGANHSGSVQRNQSIGGAMGNLGNVGRTIGNFLN